MQQSSNNLLFMRIIFFLYTSFGLIVDSLWIFDFFKFGKKIYPIIGIIILILGNSFQTYLTYHSFIKKEFIKLSRTITYLLLLISGISVYVSTYGANSHFTIYTVSAIIAQILFALYGITLMMGRNQKIKDLMNQSQLENTSMAEVQNSSVFLYDPELPDCVSSYNNNMNDNSLSDTDSEYELNEKKKYFINGIKRDESIDEVSIISHHFAYPEQIDVSDDSITDADSTNPYSARNLELYGVSMQV